MDAVESGPDGGWVAEIFLRRPYSTIAMTASGQKDLGSTYVIYVPFANEASAIAGLSDLVISVRFLPGNLVKGEVVSDAGDLPEGGRVLALPGAVERDGEEVGG